MSGAEKHTGGIRRWWRGSRRRPPAATATADTAQGARTRAHLPGPPAEIHTARHATDTWGVSSRRPTGPETTDSGRASAPPHHGGSEASG